MPETERVAVANAVEALRSALDLGKELGYPHTSKVQGTKVRELRPRTGRSAWRAFYARVGSQVWLLAVGPEAQHDSRGFRRAVILAETRLAEIRQRWSQG